jgi:hypothetical protein
VQVQERVQVRVLVLVPEPVREPGQVQVLGLHNWLPSIQSTI